MVLGVSDFDSVNLTTTAGVTGNADTLGGAISASVPVGFGKYGSLYNTSTFTAAKSSPEENKHAGHLGLSSELHYTNFDEYSSAPFVDAYVGAEISGNQTYNQTRDYGVDVGLYAGVARTQEGTPVLVPKFGPHLTLDASERENSHFSVDAALTAGLAVGTQLRDAETSLYAYGRGYQELTNRKNLHTEVGVGLGKPVNIFGAEVNISAEVGYGKNWSGGTTNNYVKKQDGFAGRIGVSIDL